MIEGTPVQFLPACSSLQKEALSSAREIEYEGVQTNVFEAEHLLAIAVATGRAKDKARVPLFLESGAIQMDRLEAILKKHHLFEKWLQWTN